jgi:hypothetical protein
VNTVLGDAALYFASHGWRVFPVEPQRKAPPLTARGCLDASDDPGQVRAWWKANPDANLAVAAGAGSGILVLDFDVRGGKPGLHTLEQLEERFGSLHGTLIQKTPSGGLHLIFKHPEGVEIKNGVEVLPGLDVRSDGGYAVICPSVLADGEYQWIDHTVPPAALPSGMVELLQQREQPKHEEAQDHTWTGERVELIEQARRHLAKISGAIEGEGGDLHTFVTACHLVRGFDLTDVEALMLLSEWNSKCRPPWSRSELQAKIASARRNGGEVFGGRVHTEEPPKAEEPKRDGKQGQWKVPPYWQWLDVAQRKDWQCKPLVWTVQDLIAKGNFVILAAETQTGKTLFSLFLSHSILRPDPLFGKLPITPVSKILYMGLEDPDRRFNERLEDIEQSFVSELENGRFILHIAPDFTLTEPKMIEYLENLITTNGFDVVFLDTYQKATPGITSFDDAKQATILHPLANLTRRTGVTLIVLDHVRKRQNGTNRNELAVDDIKGTGAKPQNADCIILVERTPDRKQAKLQSFSKDSDVNIRFLLDIAPKGSQEAKFKYASDLEALGKQSAAVGDENRRKVAIAMPPGEWINVPEIAKRVHLAESTVQVHIKKLVEEKKVGSNGLNGKLRAYRRIAGAQAGANSNESATGATA